MEETFVLEAGRAIVFNEPRGENGLEGFQRNDEIKYHIVKRGKETWYRVWQMSWEKDNYYETCGKNIFGKFFTKKN